MKIYNFNGKPAPALLLALLGCCAFLLGEVRAFSAPAPGGSAGGGDSKPMARSTSDMPPLSSSSSSSIPKSAWELERISPSIVRIEGQTRKTWAFKDIDQETVQVGLRSEGRPIHVEIELWIGPNWTPCTLKAYSEDGFLRPIQTLMGTRNKEATIEVRNTGQHELSLQAAASYAPPPLANQRAEIPNRGTAESKYVEGGAIKSFTFDPNVEQVQVLLNTGTRQLHANVELLSGPNNVKQRFQVFTNNGMLNSMFVVFNTPGPGNVVRITNLATVEFPLQAFVEPSQMNEKSAYEPVIGGGDRSW